MPRDVHPDTRPWAAGPPFPDRVSDICPPLAGPGPEVAGRGRVSGRVDGRAAGRSATANGHRGATEGPPSRSCQGRQSRGGAPPHGGRAGVESQGRRGGESALRSFRRFTPLLLVPPRELPPPTKTRPRPSPRPR